MLKGRKILLGVTGSIAAFKVPALIRLLIKEGAEVQVILTPSARDFVTPLTISTLSQRPALTEPFSSTDGSWNSHVDMGNWADIMLVAPVSANTLGKMANGLADNLLVAAYLAAKCPVYIAPAMDLDMFRHPSTQRNIKTLLEYGNKIIPPKEGELASGLCGAGRMEEPEEIVNVLIEELKKKNILKGKKALVTAGPTYEAIDPVRFIGNHSSGLMGIEIARALMLAGAEVELVCGPVKYDAPAGIKRHDVVNAEQMLKVCSGIFHKSDILVMAAAVADYKPVVKAADKIKKSEDKISLDLTPNPDILATLATKKTPKQFIVGFALETSDGLINARTKLKKKKLDMIVLNSPGEDEGFGSLNNRVTLIFSDDKIKEFPVKPKREVASDIVDAVIEAFSHVKN